jgi:cell division protein FtsW
LFTISFILSIATIFFFPETKGASRWIKLFNFSLQPTEILKPSFVILSSLLLGRYNNKRDFSFLLNIILFGLISLILLSQPDFGMFILFFSVWILQVLNSNLEKKIIFPILGLFFLTFILSYLFIDHVKFRIDNFLFPNIGDNYQITKSLESFANGGLFGQGIGNGTVSKNLPDAHSDFIYALIGEEFGFITAFSVLIFYIIIYIRIYFVSKITKNLFILNSLTGLGNILIFQTIINISSSLNLLPTKGMTLPFISYGGSSIISSSLVVGFILTLIKNAKNQ